MTTRTNGFWPAVGVFLGTLIGAGIFSLPYIFKSAGVLTGFAFLALAAAVSIPVHRMYAEVILRTPGEHRFVGYARIHLGRFAGLFTILVSVVQSVLVLAIYLVLSKSFAALLWPSGGGFHGLVLFWAFASAAIFLNLRRLALLESMIVIGIAGIVAALFFLGAGKLPGASFPLLVPAWQSVFLPLGPVLFALYGRSAIPGVTRLTNEPGKAIAWSIAAAALVYALFALAVLALSPVVTADAVSGLRGFIPSWALAGVGALGILSLFSSYVSIGQDVSESARLDLDLPVWTRFLIVIFGPIALVLAGFTSFLTLVGFVGGVLLALEGIVIVLMWRAAASTKLGLGPLALIAVFAVAIITTVIR